MNWKYRVGAFVLGASLLATSIAPGAVFAEGSNDPLVTSTIMYEGKNNGNGDLDITQIGRYNSGVHEGDGGTVEIVAYNDAQQVAYVVNGKKRNLSRIPLDSLASGKFTELKADKADKDNDVGDLVEDKVDGFSYGDMTSVAYHPGKNLVAVAVQAKAYDAPGYVVFFRDNGENFEYVNMAQVGVQPDMVTFNESGTLAITADEGEPREGYGEGVADPKGTVSLVDTGTIGAGEVPTTTVLDFTAFDSESEQEKLVDKNIILKKNSKPSEDLEPEYVATTGDKAYVALQENNAIAVVNLKTKEIETILSAGFIDHSKVAIDIDKSDEVYNPKTYKGLYGISMPDGIEAVTIGGEDYLLLANEGDARDWKKYSNEIKDTTSPSGKIETEKKVTYFDVSDYDGLPHDDADYLFGGRGFTMMKVNGDEAEIVYNSGSDFEKYTNQYYPDYFNVSNDNVEKEDRSGKKGPEPETVIAGRIGKKMYAFIALERIGGVMVYDITNPQAATFVNYINSRDFSADIQDDVSPEGLAFVRAANSPTKHPLLLTAMEVSGTLAVYELEGKLDESKKPNDGWIWLKPVEPEKEKPVPEEKDDEETGDLASYGAYMTGYPDGTFRPDAKVTRAEFAAMFSRLAGMNEMSASFADVDGHWAKGFIGAMESEGLMAGYPDGSFGPDRAMTRGEVAKIVAFAEEYVSADPSFDDVNDHWAKGFIGAVEKAGLIQGYPDGTFHPDGTITRAEVATILSNWKGRTTETNDISKDVSAKLTFFDDVSSNHWAYLTILDATNAHKEREDGTWVLD